MAEVVCSTHTGLIVVLSSPAVQPFIEPLLVVRNMSQNKHKKDKKLCNLDEELHNSD